LRPIDARDAAEIVTLILTAFAAQSIVTDPPPLALRSPKPMSHPTSAKAPERLRRPRATWSVRSCGMNTKAATVSADWLWTLRGYVRASPEPWSWRPLVLLDNRRLFAACGFVETARDAHPEYAEPTFVNMEKRLAE